MNNASINPRLTVRDMPRTDVGRLRVEIEVQSSGVHPPGATPEYDRLHKRGRHVLEIYEDALPRLEALVETEEGYAMWESAKRISQNKLDAHLAEKMRGATATMTPSEVNALREQLVWQYTDSTPEREFQALSIGTGRSGLRPLKSVRVLERGIHPLSDAHTATVREVISHLGTGQDLAMQAALQGLMARLDSLEETVKSKDAEIDRLRKNKPPRE